ncbi:MAG: anti-sigma factor [Acidobacteria bacterium]|nr:MAG: anti-sigma factor [Acidobacteriota bacterium]
MVCKDVIRRLSEFLDRELAPDLARELERHLERCEDCNIVVDTTRKTIEIYCNTEPLPLPEDVRARLDRALAEKLGRKES